MTSLSATISVENLTEEASLAIASGIQFCRVPTLLVPNGIQTAYICQGQKKQPPILLLHGFDSSVLEFRKLMPLLSSQAQTWSVDLLGFGFTERPDNLDISAAAIRQHLYAFWQSVIQTPVVLVGASMGGATAIDFALCFPDAVAKLVLIDSAGYRSGPALGPLLWEPLGYWLTEGFLKKPKVRQQICEKAYHDPTFASPDALACAALHLDRQNWAKALISFTRAGGYRSLRKDLPKLQPSTLILWGESDRILGTADAVGFQQAIPESQLVWIPECGHVPHLEKPDVVARAILEFVAGALCPAT